ncbi:NADH dehydrogenase [ubiquinone] 1 beta subcomplex subunit 2, mitochondrial-like [Trichogramma pretiosum]|uniref:NADH dehydrogenase [ubiquinone] 1 beta subcomplex subunit 2, mitochondrial n=1 Tax=Trichogramma kaykai TaxID=54128 RepID=A0ABD2X085_9HYME|nr:NADH dehydrogenase [ubiquinone] 1 beta subcomplex subunit 2, mitochondrial-like [Trichogramma pretiosum]
MIGSKAFGLLKEVARRSGQKTVKTNFQQIRLGSHSAHPHGGWCYRTAPTPPAWAVRGANFCATVCWFWFWWNIWHGWPHLIGLYDGEFLPDPRKYTDEELGIPPLEKKE